jgi:hypothetical protein
MRGRSPKPGELEALFDADRIVFGANLRTRNRLRALMIASYVVVSATVYSIAVFLCTPSVGIWVFVGAPLAAVLPSYAIRATRAWKDTER